MTIQIERLSKTFPTSPMPALKGISFSLKSGEILGLVGPDGAGKTTLMRLMAALLLPTEGKISVLGHDTVQEAEKVRAYLGYMPQRFGLYEDLTVIQNLHLYAELQSLPKAQWQERFEELLAFTGLKPFVHRLSRALSGGMKQKLGLCCSLLTSPKLLLLDEPSVGVDPLSRRELWKMVASLAKKGVSIVWSTVYLEEAEKCDRILLLNEGKIVYEGEPQNLTNGQTFPRLEDAFFSLLGGKKKGVSLLAQAAPPLQEGPEEVVIAEGLTKRFGAFTAVDRLSFRIRRGEIFGLLGPNGAGKSTSFKMLCGLLKPTEGRALVEGLDFQEAPGEARQKIGYMAQKFSLYGNLTVWENLRFFSGIYQLHERRREAIERMVEIFKLDAFVQRSAETLPFGFKQKLALAAAMMHWPELLFLDEPTSGMDPVSRREFWTHVHGLTAKGRTVLVTTHFMDEAENCDRLALIYGGKIIYLDTPVALKRSVRSSALPNPTLEDAFIKWIEREESGCS